MADGKVMVTGGTSSRGFNAPLPDLISKRLKLFVEARIY
jgi:hypothetical protein